IRIGYYFAPMTTPESQPSLRSILSSNEVVSKVDKVFARFIYDACIPRNAVNSIYLQPSVDAIAAIGPGYPDLSCYVRDFFITLGSINEHKHDLQALAIDKFFVESRYAKLKKGKYVISIILDNKLWDDISVVVQTVAPLMSILRIVDSNETPSIGCV
ncbi:hypothetical protein CFOL_v3_29358, partial [Cephalotus follicularis]